MFMRIRSWDNEGFVYVLASGDEGTVHIDHVLEYNRDPGYMADLLLYELTCRVRKAVERSPLSTREIKKSISHRGHEKSRKIKKFELLGTTGVCYG